MARGRPDIDHLLRRSGFGASASDASEFQRLSMSDATDRLLQYERLPDDVDSKIGQSGYLSSSISWGSTSTIDSERQRWLFRMVHTRRPLEEKMALFWHNHFATAYSKIDSAPGVLQLDATRMLARPPAYQVTGPPGQIDLFRQYALGKFRDLLFAVAKDPAMLFWLDGRTNTRDRPQENFGREIMELFTFGVGHYTEQDVYTAARVFTGWSVRKTTLYEFIYNANQHDSDAKTFTFAIHSDGGRTIPARPPADGIQDGVDFIAALARHPDTARRLARKLWSFFISEVNAPDPAFVEAAAAVYLENDTSMKAVVGFVLRSEQFLDSANYYTRYGWPVEFVVRAIQRVGWRGFPIYEALTPLRNMGQQLFEPPNVAGWALGPAWFSTGAMLERMNFAVSLVTNQRFNLVRDAAVAAATPEGLLAFFLDRLSVPPFDRVPYNALLDYLRTEGEWTGTNEQLKITAPGLARLIVGSAEYQFV